MKQLHLLVLFFFAFSCATQVPQSPEPELAVEDSSSSLMGLTSEKKDLIMIDHKYFKVAYDPELRSARYVVYELKAENLKKSKAKRKDRFIVDPYLVSNEIPFVKPAEYSKSGYDKGHLAPSADFEFSQEANDMTFVMSNMAPQKGNLNRDSWRRLENQTRKWACGEEHLTVITGAIFTKDMPTLKSGLVIPPSFFKVLIDETPPKKVLTFVYHQTDKGDVLEKREQSLGSLKAMLGKDIGLKIAKLTKSVSRLPASRSKWKEANCDN